MVKGYFSVLLLSIFCIGILFADRYHQRTFSFYSTTAQKFEAKVLGPPLIKGTKYRLLCKLRNLNKTAYITYPTTQSLEVSYGDIIQVTGRTILPEPPRNPGQFDYPSYLRRKGINALISAKQIKVIGKGWKNPFRWLAYSMKDKIMAKTRSTLPQPYSDLYIGLVFGEHGTQLPKDLQAQYRRVGLTHLLVVSGSQVALLSGVMLSICRVMGLGIKRSFVVMSMINTLFYFVTGGGASIFRAVIMAEMALGIKVLRRHVSIYHVIVLTALIMLLISPFSLFDAGAQLSFLATISLIVAAPKLIEALPKRWPVVLRESVGVSTAPFIWTAPLLWKSFNVISPISLISNILVVSWIELIVTVGFFSTLIGFVAMPITKILNNFALAIMWLLNAIVSVLAQVQWGSINLKSPPVVLVIVIYVCLVILFQSLGTPNMRRWRYAVIGIGVVVLIPLVLSLFPSRFMTLTMIDVGQGDGMLLETPANKVFLIDAASSDVISVLNAKGINKIDGLIITHNHMDHDGAVPEILAAFPVGFVMGNGSGQHETIEALSGQSFVLQDDLKINVLFPNKHPIDHNENNDSVVLMISYKEMDFLMMGDLEIEGETQLLTMMGNQLDAEVLKVGHHGSKTSSTEAFVRQVSPELALVSVGRRNRFKHPSLEVMARFQRLGVPVLRTDQNGAIEIKTDGHRLWTKTYLSHKQLQI